MKVPHGYLPLPGSERLKADGARRSGPANPHETINVTIVVRRRVDELASRVHNPWRRVTWRKRKHQSHKDFVNTYGAAVSDLDRVATFARSAGLTVTGRNLARRTLELSGNVSAVARAFAVDLGYFHSPERRFRGREGHVYVPAELLPVIEGVFGLDNRKLGGCNAGGQPSTAPLKVLQVAELYNFPVGLNGSGQTIGILAMGGGYDKTTVDSYFRGPGSSPPVITPVFVGGATNNYGVIPDADLEVTQDICIAGAIAPGASIAVYFANPDSLGWITALGRAIHPDPGDPTPSVLSISFFLCKGDDDATLGKDTSPSHIDQLHQLFCDAQHLPEPLTVLATSGDKGSDSDVGDGLAHVQYPASDPCVTCCGGTTLGNFVGRSFDEVAWNDTFFVDGKPQSGATGGGVSARFPLPAYQLNANIPSSINDGKPGRGLPDIAGNASPNSGYSISGIVMPSGTSAVAPLYAGLIALINAKLGRRVGFLNEILYSLGSASPTVLQDITDGGDNSFSTVKGYPCGQGWDACTGLGRIDGTALLNYLSG